MDRAMKLKPFFTYYGGKWRVAPRYPAPRYDILVEPFAGAAGYSLRHWDRFVILVEKDPVVTATWRYLLTAREEEILDLPDVQEGQTVDDLELPTGARYLIGWWLNKGTTRPNRKPSAWMRQGTHADSFWGGKIRERIAGQLPYIRHWTLLEGEYGDAPDVEATWFVDPPYQRAGTHYVQSSRALDFDVLSTWCRSRRGQVMVCENDGADWLPFKPFLAAKGLEGKHGGKVSMEALWTGDTDART